MKGIYKIECVVNGKIYIGSTTVCFKKRFKKHKQRLRHDYHENNYLQNEWNKHGEENFIFDVIENIEDNEQIKIREGYWLSVYFSKGRDFCYNLSDHVCGGNTLKTEEIRKKQSENIKKSYTPELLERRRIDSLKRVDEFVKNIKIAKEKQSWKDNHKKNMIEISKRPSWLEKTRANAKAKGKKVKTDLGEIFDSVAEAARQTGSTRSRIRKAIKGIYKTSMGRKWYYC